MFGKTMVIVNPAARSGKAAEAAAQAKLVFERLQAQRAIAEEAVFRYTVGPKDATAIAKHEGTAFDTVVVLGGDGIVNETVNGLMGIKKAIRPQLALIPCGNGDDFARTIGMDRSPKRSLQQLEAQELKPVCIDVVNANGAWYAETLSFGLDAAIALGTAELRKKTNRTGTTLYLQCGIDQLVNHRVVRKGTLQLDGGEPQNIEFYLFAVQNGISYGGGFKICPEASLTDGLIDICYATPPLSASAAIRLLLKAKNGKHTNHANLCFTKAQSVQLTLSEPIPTQIDGEAFPDTKYHIVVHPNELTVLMPSIQ